MEGSGASGVETCEEIPGQENKKAEQRNTVHIVVFGKDGAGKSALIVRFLTKRFIHEYDPTSEDVYAYNTLVDGHKACIKIMDTAGLVEKTVRKQEEQINWGDGYLLLLSLTSRESLKDVVRIKDIIDQVQETDKPTVLVANKRDLVHAREVTSQEVHDLAERWRCKYFETSATEDYAFVSEPFYTLYRDILRVKEQRGIFPKLLKLDKEIVLADVNKRYRNRLLTS